MARGAEVGCARQQSWGLQLSLSSRSQRMLGDEQVRTFDTLVEVQGNGVASGAFDCRLLFPRRATLLKAEWSTYR